MTFIASEFTWFNLLPGYNGAEESVAGMFGDTLMGEHVHTITHISLSVLATLIVLGFAFMTKSAWEAADDEAIPDGKVSIRSIIETLMDAALSLGEQVFGNRKDAKRFLPLIGTLGLYILFSNLLGLVPGFAPPTDNLNVTVPPAIVVFLATHYLGVKENGAHYFEHFLGPKIGGLPWLAPIMLPIEIISHFARPLSLSLRLMGNMTGDHKVLAIFLTLAAFPIIFPIPILILGTVVCFVQALVFSLLTMVYIALAIEHSEEAH